MSELCFDGQATWATQLPRGYDVDLSPGDSTGWKPTLTITPHGSGVDFAPGYAVCYGGIWNLPDEVEVPAWMRAAIERTGFDYDPEPNHEKRDRVVAQTHPDQQTLVEV